MHLESVNPRDGVMQIISDPYFIGVDVGGTKVAAGLVNSAGKITHQTRTPMVATDAMAGLAAVISAIDSVRAGANLYSNSKPHSPISGIGICAPGPLNPHTGVVVNPPNGSSNRRRLGGRSRLLRIAGAEQLVDRDQRGFCGSTRVKRMTSTLCAPSCGVERSPNSGLLGRTRRATRLPVLGSAERRTSDCPARTDCKIITTDGPSQPFNG